MSISVKNFAANAAIIALCMLLVAFSFFAIGRGYVLDTTAENMRSSAGEMARTAAAISEEESLNSWTLKMTLSSVSRASGTHIFVTDLYGTVMCCSDEEILCEHMGKQLDAAEMGEVVGNETGTRRTTLGGLYDTERLTVAVPIEMSEGNVIGYVFESTDRSDVFSPWIAFGWMCLAILVAIFVAVMCFSYWYSRHMAAPLDELASASRQFARGNFAVRVKQTEETTGEMGALIDAFNSMADSLENAESRRSEFISNVSHELRTPMTTIAGFADGILDGTIPPEEQNKYLKSIRDETRRLARLVRNMLESSRTEARAKSGDKSHWVVFDLSELTVEILLSFEDRANKKHLDVDPQLPDAALMVRADKDAITRVIYNLLDNAVKFARDGGTITLRIYKDDERGKAFISVKDEGETIPADDLPYIFDRFHKSDRSRSIDTEGVGLGLYFVKTIINAHGEDIAVNSANGATEFAFTLPLA